MTHALAKWGGAPHPGSPVSTERRPLVHIGFLDVEVVHVEYLALLVGGPDGLGDEARAAAGELWSLSALTLPHPLVRVVLAEQLYRAWSVLRNHPYHRA